MTNAGESRHADVLSGRSIVVTRPRHQQSELVDALVAAGAEPVSLPLIDIVEDGAGIEALRRLLADADAIAWVVVSSPNGARVVAMLHEEGCSLPPVAVVGEATAEVIGHSVDLVSSRGNAASLVEDFPDGTGRVVVVQGSRANNVLVDGLAAKGWMATRCNVYRTLDTTPNTDDLRRVLAADAVVFASGSAVENWTRLFGDTFRGSVVVIGPSTKIAAEAAGLAVSAVAGEPSVEGIVEALASSLSP